MSPKDSNIRTIPEDNGRPMICLDDVTLTFRRSVSLLDRLLRSKRSRKARFTALSRISLRVYEGDILGIIGRNGSGKSSLSMVCTSVYRPDSGTVSTRGTVQLLTLGLGFQNQLTGRDNVFINGSLLGFSSRQLKKRMDDIKEFADIGDFFDEPVKTYSSGMRSRLAFAIATAIRPDILILDEIMSTGDKEFREKAIKRIRNLGEIAKCAIVISHNPTQVKKMCNRVVWLEQGRLVMQGDPRDVLGKYSEFCKNPADWKARNPEIFVETNDLLTPKCDPQ